MSFKETRNEGKRRGASPRCEPAGIRALGSKVFIVRMALGGTAVCLEERSNARDWDAPEGYYKLNPTKRRVEEREPRATNASLGRSGTRFTPEKSSE